jgi:lysozyme
MTASVDLALKLVVEFEGFRSHPYQDGTGRWTIGYGETHDNMGLVTEKTLPVTQFDAARMAETTLEHIRSAILREPRPAVLLPSAFEFNKNQLAALMDFAYNLGLGRLFASTLWFRAVRNDPVAFAHFMDYVYAGGMQEPGLIKRRRAEQTLFQTPVSPVTPPQQPSPPQSGLAPAIPRP